MYILSIFELYQWIAESLSFLALYDITYVVSQKSCWLINGSAN